LYNITVKQYARKISAVMKIFPLGIILHIFKQQQGTWVLGIFVI
jgi:hypothetical protein